MPAVARSEEDPIQAVISRAGSPRTADWLEPRNLYETLVPQKPEPSALGAILETYLCMLYYLLAICILFITKDISNNDPCKP